MSRKELWMWLCETKSNQLNQESGNFSIKGLIINILSLAGYVVSVVTT